MEKHVGWDDKYKVGHNLIDSQHKQLFDIADKLYVVAYEKAPYRDYQFEKKMAKNYNKK